MILRFSEEERDENNHDERIKTSYTVRPSPILFCGKETTCKWGKEWRYNKPHRPEIELFKTVSTIRVKNYRVRTCLACRWKGYISVTM